jgi:cytoskeleton protein RodZ
MRVGTGSFNDRHAVRHERHLPDANGSNVKAPAEDVGAALRDARQRRGLSLEEIARATKIRVAILRAVETDRRDELPEAIFLRGFVRAYAREVGLDPDKTSSRYLAQFEPLVDVITADATEGPAAAPRERTPVAPNDDGPLSVRNRRIVIFAVIAISLVGYTLTRWPTSRSASPSVRSVPVSEVGRSSSTSQPARVSDPGTADLRASTAGSADQAAVIHFTLTAAGPCWLSATADGTRVVYGLMRPGQQQSFDVHKAAVLRVGDPAAFTFTINGEVGRSLGQAGEAVSVHITKENYRDFLRR